MVHFYDLDMFALPTLPECLRQLVTSRKTPELV
jgi:hypothetical protein